MLFLSDIIQANVELGLKPVLQHGKNLVLLFQCLKCKQHSKMVKFVEADWEGHVIRAPKKSQCVCGYIYYTTGWKGIKSPGKPISLDTAFKAGLRTGSATI